MRFSLSLREKADQDIIQWLNGFAKSDKSIQIRMVLKEHIKGLGKPERSVIRPISTGLLDNLKR